MVISVSLLLVYVQTFIYIMFRLIPGEKRLPTTTSYRRTCSELVYIYKINVILWISATMDNISSTYHMLCSVDKILLQRFGFIFSVV